MGVYIDSNKLVIIREPILFILIYLKIMARIQSMKLFLS